VFHTEEESIYALCVLCQSVIPRQPSQVLKRVMCFHGCLCIFFLSLHSAFPILITTILLVISCQRSSRIRNSIYNLNSCKVSCLDWEDDKTRSQLLASFQLTDTGSFITTKQIIRQAGRHAPKSRTHACIALALDLLFALLTIQIRRESVKFSDKTR